MVKNPPANAGETRHLGSIPGSGRSPGGGNGKPLQYSGEFHGQRSLAGYNPWGLKSIRHNCVIKQQQYPYEDILENPVSLLEALLVLLKYILTFSRTELTKREHRIGPRGQKEIGRGQWRKKVVRDNCVGEIEVIILPRLHAYRSTGICSPKAVCLTGE